MAQMAPVRDVAHGATLYVHPECGGTVWSKTDPNTTGTNLVEEVGRRCKCPRLNQAEIRCTDWRIVYAEQVATAVSGHDAALAPGDRRPTGHDRADRR